MKNISKYTVACCCTQISWMIVFMLWLLGHPEMTYASHITMVPHFETGVTQDRITVRLTVRNNGDEDSLVVFPTLKLGDTSVQLEKTPYIAFGGSRNWKYEFDIAETGIQKQGIYPLFFTLTYHDANMYPFSMIQVYQITYEKASNLPPILGQISLPKEIKRDLDGSYKFVNSLSQPIFGKVHLFFPKELDVKPIQTPFDTQAGGTLQVPFHVQNKGALLGSRYHVFAVLEYDYLDQHYTSIMTHLIHVSGTDTTLASFFGKPIPSTFYFQIVGGVLLFFALFGMIFYLETRRLTEKDKASHEN